MILQAPPTLQPPQIPQFNWGPDLSPLLAQIGRGDFSGIPILRSIDFSNLIVTLKTIAIIVIAVCVVALVIIVLKSRKMFQEEMASAIKAADLTPPAEAKGAYDARWQEIRNHVESFKEAEWKLAVIEADKLVDDVLKVAGYPGETMGERLTMIKPDQLINVQHLWDAHKLRNLLVHDANYQLTHKQAIWAIDAFQSVLHELGALG